MDSAKRLRSLIESYQEVPEKFQPVFNYISLAELWKMRHKELSPYTNSGELEIYRRLIKAVDYWVRKDFHFPIWLAQKRCELENGLVQKNYSVVEHYSMVIAKTMLEQMGLESSSV